MKQQLTKGDEVKAIATTTLNGLRFYLTDQGFGTDIQSLTNGFKDRTDAAFAASKANAHFRALGLRSNWHGAYLVDDVICEESEVGK